MNKIKVTDEMVTTALKIYEAYAPCVTKKSDAMHHALEAALNPPPEAVVTDEMLDAGNSAYHKWFGNGRPCLEVYGHVYRAMRRLEPKSEAVEPFAAQAVPAPGQPWVRGLHYDWREMRKWGSGSGSGNCDR